MTAVADRIRRLLLLVPQAARARDGVPVEALAARLGISPDELLEEIDFLMLVGKPPFSPADFLDIYVEGERVHVGLAQSFVRPPRFTHEEALALLAGGQTLLGGETGEWGAALAGVLGKLEAAMIPAERERYAHLKDRILLQGAVPVAGEVHEVLRRAVSERRAVTMTYWSAGRGAVGERLVHPFGILSHGGYWYLVAGPEGEGGYKLYRADRIREARLSGPADGYDVPAGLDLEHLRPGLIPGTGEAPVRVRVAAEQARWVRERFPEVQVESEEEGAVVFVLVGASWEWVTPWVLASGGAAQVLAPAGLARRVADEARRILARYQD